MSMANCRRSRSPSSFTREGIREIYLVSENPDAYPASMIAPGVKTAHRDELDSVMKACREVKGASAIVFVQTCAAEKRRRRKRGLMEDPARRVMINPAVCEGCGDCSVQSNCISVEPLETEFGRKRTINQSTCNKDYSCVKGFCPSFVTVDGGKPRRRAPADARRHRRPCRSPSRSPRWNGPITSPSAASAAPAC